VSADDRLQEIEIRRIDSKRDESVLDHVVTEAEVAIRIRDEIVIRAACSPGDLETWALGYLRSEGWIETLRDAEVGCEEEGIVHVRIHRSKPTPHVESIPDDRTFEMETIQAALRALTERATLFGKTGGAHVMGFADASGLQVHAEDVCRTCALERAIGEAVRRELDLGCMVALLSSRVPLRLLEKLARCRIPVAVAVSAPTAQAVRRARELRMGLVGFARENRLNVYAHGWRIGQ